MVAYGICCPQRMIYPQNAYKMEKRIIEYEEQLKRRRYKEKKKPDNIILNKATNPNIYDK